MSKPLTDHCCCYLICTRTPKNLTYQEPGGTSARTEASASVSVSNKLVKLLKYLPRRFEGTASHDFSRPLNCWWVRKKYEKYQTFVFKLGWFSHVFKPFPNFQPTNSWLVYWWRCSLRTRENSPIGGVSRNSILENETGKKWRQHLGQLKHKLNIWKTKSHGNSNYVRLQDKHANTYNSHESSSSSSSPSSSSSSK